MPQFLGASMIGRFFSVLSLAVMLVAATSSGLAAQESINLGALSGQDHLTVTQWVTPILEGRFEGRTVLPLADGGVGYVAGAEVFLVGKGEVMHRGYSNRAGHVVIDGVEPGVYGMIARAKGLVACYAMHVIDSDQPGSDLYPSKAEIALQTIDHQSFWSIVLPRMRSDYDLDTLSIEEERLDDIVSHARGNERYRVTRTQGGMVGYLYGATDHGRAIDDEDRDRLDPAEFMTVLLFKDGRYVGRDLTDERGRFDFQTLPAGLYSLITVGPDGVGAVGFELMDLAPLDPVSDLDLPSPADSIAADDSSEETTLTRTVQGQALTQSAFAMQVVPFSTDVFGRVLQESPLEQPSDVVDESDEVLDDVVAPMDGSFTGSGFSGGGGGGGGGGIGSVAGLAGVAIAGSLVASDSPDNPVSPSVP